MIATNEQWGKVVVLYGGTSAEREVSLKSGAAVHQALLSKGVDAALLDVNDDAVKSVTSMQADRAFIALHGAGGEDGRIQAVLEFLGVPYTGSGVQASAIAMDKWRSKQIFVASGIPTPNFMTLDRENAEDVIAELGCDLMVKPAHEGSSIGMTKVSSLEELKQAYVEASRYDACVFAEALVKGAEYTVAILNGVALSPIKLETDHQFYDYDAKYLANDTRYLCPCGLSEDKELELKTVAKQAFEALGCRGWGRVDVMADSDGQFYVLEVNTVPGMTDHSLVPMAAKQDGMEMADLCLAILQQTLPETTKG